MGLSQSHRAIIRDVSRAFAACLAAGEGKVECAVAVCGGRVCRAEYAVQSQFV